MKLERFKISEPYFQFHQNFEMGIKPSTNLENLRKIGDVLPSRAWLLEDLSFKHFNLAWIRVAWPKWRKSTFSPSSSQTHDHNLIVIVFSHFDLPTYPIWSLKFGQLCTLAPQTITYPFNLLFLTFLVTKC